MSYAMPIAVALHTLAAIIWVGGMFFAHMALRPSAMALEPPLRLPLWRGVFGRFFPWVWVCVSVLLASGYWIALSYYGGMKNVGLYIHLMSGLGVLMAGLFVFLWLVPYRGMKQALDADDLPGAARHQGRIRLIITINLVLGLVVSVLGAAGRWL